MKYENIKKDKLTFKFNQPEQEVLIDIPIAGGIATLSSKPTSSKIYEVRLEIDRNKKFSFKIDKPITDIGSNNKNHLLQITKR